MGTSFINEPHSPFRHPYSSILIEMCPCHVLGWRRRKRPSMWGERLCLTTEFLSVFPTNTYKVDKNVKKLAFDSSRIPNPRDEPNCNLSRIPTQLVQPNERLYKTCTAQEIFLLIQGIFSKPFVVRRRCRESTLCHLHCRSKCNFSPIDYN